MDDKPNHTPAAIFTAALMISASILIAAFYKPPQPTLQQANDARMQEMIDMGLTRTPDPIQ